MEFIELNRLCKYMKESEAAKFLFQQILVVNWVKHGSSLRVLLSCSCFYLHTYIINYEHRLKYWNFKMRKQVFLVIGSVNQIERGWW